MGGSLFSFKDQYCSYAEYHNNTTNRLIHTIFVPTLIWTALVMITANVTPFAAWAGDAYGVPLNLSFVLATIYASYYTILHPVIGGFGGFMIYAAFYTSNIFVLQGKALTGIQPVHFALGLHIVAWLIQFVGHGVFEKRAPALLDNLLQELQLATDERVAAFKKKSAKKNK
ncbi:UNVERIFIED_CONTAM: hypothetical protein HDU68_003434 [Siphonaria sp. JEL0065]|nr:hypothetical protein HDU68_003434 [Siphonaria sp. JEL0065]